LGASSTAAFGNRTGGAGLFEFAGTHTYATAGVYTIGLKVTDNRTPGGSASTKGSITVSDAPLMITAPGSLLEMAGVSFTFGFDWKDPDSAATASKYGVTIGWGDGSTDSNGTVSGSFHASADHIYAAVGSYDLEVTITDQNAKGGATVLANFTIPVNVVEKTVNPSPMPNGNGNSSSSSCAMGGSTSASEGIALLFALLGVALFLRRRRS
jgi:MYXO-CTERM domain-containing protein